MGEENKMEEKNRKIIYTPRYLGRRISEFITLKNKCNREWKRLARESLKIAKENKSSLELLDLDNLPEDIFEFSGSKEIPIYTERGNIQNIDLLFRLSKNKYPGLYHKFKRHYQKYLELEEEMKAIRDYFNNLKIPYSPR